ncbi:unnamed protein product [Cercopithifilaria johnstoni]|uniref:Uncharacterized protein n=1 Tax=Cercopithifilaria johnstoni TaxID=2874296 RepID=A0A8J2M466_9BILA|nr:unnamed protein product [Cercopithifilaria johnstoni]
MVRLIERTLRGTQGRGMPGKQEMLMVMMGGNDVVRDIGKITIAITIKRADFAGVLPNQERRRHSYKFANAERRIQFLKLSTC